MRHGVSPGDLIDGAHFGEAGFWPHRIGWRTSDWFEMIISFGSTFAYVVLIADRDGTNAELRGLCRSFTSILHL